MTARTMTAREWSKARAKVREDLDDDRPIVDGRRCGFVAPDRMVDSVLAFAYSVDLTDMEQWRRAAESAVARYGLVFVKNGPVLRLRCAATDEELPQLLDLRGANEVPL